MVQMCAALNGGLPLTRMVPKRAIGPGLTGRIDAVLGTFSKVYARSRAAGGADLHFIGFLYRVTPVGGTLRDEVEGSTDMCAWFRPAELPPLRIVGVARHAIRLVLPGLAIPEPEYHGPPPSEAAGSAPTRSGG